MDTKIEYFIYDSGIPGPSLTVIGAVHGNEKCGTIALQRLKPLLDSGQVKILKGKLTIIPIANPGAYAANKRFLERNLNRSLYPKAENERKAYEDHLDHQICGVLDNTDYLLDIHSYNSGGLPFVFLDGKDAKEKAFAESVTVTRSFIWGWQDALNKSGADTKYAGGTTEYARSKGARAFTLECGQHLDPTAPAVAYAAIFSVMKHLDLIDDNVLKRETAGLEIPPAGERKFAKMITAIMNDNIELAREFHHFEPIKSGEALALRNDGSKITAKADGYAILPHPTAATGAELLYIAIDEEPHP